MVNSLLPLFRRGLLLVAIFTPAFLSPRASAETTPAPKARMLVLTDMGADPDDEQSLVRLLLYANQDLLLAPEQYSP